MSYLLPCPFCGGEAINRSHRSCDCCGKTYTGIITCKSCPAEVSHLDTSAEAEAAWNRRTPLPLNKEK